MAVKKRVVVAGAGIAGIAAAIKLAGEGIAVTVVESAGYVGGRCRSFIHKETGEEIDNGQHLMIGAYDNFFRILRELGTIGNLSMGKAMKVRFLESGKSGMVYDSTIPGGKSGAIIGLIRLSGVSFRSKTNALLFLKKIKEKNVDTLGITALDMLRAQNQGGDMIERFWEPLILATINMPPERASADMFAEVLRRSVFADGNASAPVFSRSGLGRLTEPFSGWLRANGCELLLNSLIKNLMVQGQQAKGVVLKPGEKIEADAVISTVQPYSLNRMIPHDLAKEGFGYLGKFRYSPILSVYLWFDREITDIKFAALLGRSFQWVFNRNEINERNEDSKKRFPGHLTLTISAADEIINKTKEEIIDICIKDLTAVLPNAAKAKLLAWEIIKSRRANISVDNRSEKIRPNAFCPVENLLIAGDWTDTGLPATIEGAAQSGFVAAEKCIELLKGR